MPPSAKLPAVRGRKLQVHGNVVDVGLRRPVARPLDHRLDVCVVALEHGLDRSVPAVADPTRNLPAPRLTSRAGHISHSDREPHA